MTTMYINNTRLLASLEVTNSIKQGCSGSTAVFHMITCIIPMHMNKENVGFRYITGLMAPFTQMMVCCQRKRKKKPES